MAIRMTEIAQLLAQNATPKPDAAPPANTTAAQAPVTADQLAAAQIAAAALLTAVARQAIIAAAGDAVAQLTGAAGVLPPIAPATAIATSADTVNPGGGSDDGPTRDPGNGGGGSGTGP